MTEHDPLAHRDLMNQYQFHAEHAEAWIESARNHSAHNDMVGAGACGAVAQAHATLAQAAATADLAHNGINAYQ